MKVLFVLILLAINFTAHAEQSAIKQNKPENLKIESTTTEPTELPDPIDEPPVLHYNKSAIAVSPQEPNRVPASTTPQRYIDSELGIVCYYLHPSLIPGVATSAPPALSCLKMPVKEKPVPALPISE